MEMDSNGSRSSFKLNRTKRKAYFQGIGTLSVSLFLKVTISSDARLQSSKQTIIAPNTYNYLSSNYGDGDSDSGLTHYEYIYLLL